MKPQKKSSTSLLPIVVTQRIAQPEHLRTAEICDHQPIHRSALSIRSAIEVLRLGFSSSISRGI